MPHIIRVVVRGEFADLGPEQRATLLAEADDHDIFRSAYTAAGTLTYEPSLHAFSYRYEVRVPTDDAGPDDAAEIASERAMDLAQRDLRSRGLSSKRLRAIPTDMADMWRSD